MIHRDEKRDRDLTLQLLGPARVTDIDGNQYQLGRKNMALLAFLALQTDRASPRERLCGLLWPDSGDDQARASLRQAISQIRKAFGDAATVVVSTRDALHIDHSRVDSDVAEFLKRSEAQTIDGL